MTDNGDSNGKKKKSIDKKGEQLEAPVSVRALVGSNVKIRFNAQ